MATVIWSGIFATIVRASPIPTP